ncbi:TetR/AcrR family transcriptional regulator [Microbacterium sp. AGC85]
MSAYSIRRADAVLEATLDTLAEVGFARMTVDMIATRAHASKATIYRRWATKTDLVCAAASLVEVELIPTVAGADADVALRAILQSLRSMTVGRLGRLVRAMHIASAHEPAIQAAVREELVLPLRMNTASALTELRAEGVIDFQVDTAFAADCLVALTVDRALATGVTLSLDELETTLLSWVLPVLAPMSGRLQAKESPTRLI